MKKGDKKQFASATQNSWVLLVMGLVFAGITYGAFVWATDSGALVPYLALFAGIYYTVRTFIRAVSKLIRN